MKKSYKYLFIFTLLLLINACCTEKECSSIINGPSIGVKLSHFSFEELAESKIFLSNNNTFEILDSTSVNDSIFIINDHFIPSYSQEVIHIKDYAFIIKTPFKFDTIYNLNYNLSRVNEKCNTCFLAKDINELYEFQNFKFYHKGIPYFNNDEFVITK